MAGVGRHEGHRGLALNQSWSGAPDGQPPVLVVVHVHQDQEALLLPHEESRRSLAWLLTSLGQGQASLSDLSEMFIAHILDMPKTS